MDPRIRSLLLVAALAGAVSGAPRPTSAVGTKFHPDGSFRSFPGVTVLSMVPPEAPQVVLLERLQVEARELPFAEAFGMLPPSSFHMTVFDLVCDQVRVRERWSAKLPLDMPMDEVDRWMAARVRELEAPWPVRMRFESLNRTALSVLLEPADEESARTLRRYRSLASLRTGVRFPDHGSYRFHVSLAYFLREFEPGERSLLDRFLDRWEEILVRDFGTLVLPEVRPAVFEDMSAYPPVR